MKQNGTYLMRVKVDSQGRVFAQCPVCEADAQIRRSEKNYPFFYCSQCGTQVMSYDPASKSVLDSLIKKAIVKAGAKFPKGNS